MRIIQIQCYNLVQLSQRQYVGMFVNTTLEIYSISHIYNIPIPTIHINERQLVQRYQTNYIESVWSAICHPVEEILIDFRISDSPLIGTVKMRCFLLSSAMMIEKNKIYEIRGDKNRVTGISAIGMRLSYLYNTDSYLYPMYISVGITNAVALKTLRWRFPFYLLYLL